MQHHEAAKIILLIGVIFIAGSGANLAFTGYRMSIHWLTLAVGVVLAAVGGLLFLL